MEWRKELRPRTHARMTWKKKEEGFFFSFLFHILRGGRSFELTSSSPRPTFILFSTSYIFIFFDRIQLTTRPSGAQKEPSTYLLFHVGNRNKMNLFSLSFSLYYIGLKKKNRNNTGGTKRMYGKSVRMERERYLCSTCWACGKQSKPTGMGGIDCDR